MSRLRRPFRYDRYMFVTAWPTRGSQNFTDSLHSNALGSSSLISNQSG